MKLFGFKIIRREAVCEDALEDVFAWLDDVGEVGF